MEKVLIVSGGEKSQTNLAELLRACGYPAASAVRSGGDARRLLLEFSFELVVVNAPLTDEFGSDLAVTIAEQTAAGVILLVKTEQAPGVAAQVEDAGVFVAEKPIGRQIFYQTVKLVAAARRRMLGLKNENIQLRRKIEEIRLVDRAKCVLIQTLNMTEPQAHRYIEKQAMDMQRTRRDIAEGILKTYET